MDSAGDRLYKGVEMSLSAKDAITAAMSNIYDAKLCLIDTFLEIDCSEEEEKLGKIYESLKSKLGGAGGGEI